MQRADLKQGIQLSLLEWRVLVRRDSGDSLMQVANALGIDRCAVRRIESRALRTIGQQASSGPR
jgi:DNA-directed RNA polymerase sigma subunit (sigma70/sigma32)